MDEKQIHSKHIHGDKHVHHYSVQPVPRGFKECPLCGKVVKSQGFGGHMAGVHSVKIGTPAKLEDLQRRLATLEDMMARLKLFDGAWGQSFLPNGHKIVITNGLEKELSGHLEK